jgi:hypothetical protein
LWRGGWVVGPRYITPVVPFAAAAFALQPRGWRVFCGAAAAAIAATGLASAVCQGFPMEVQNPLREVVWPLWREGYAAPNLLQRVGVPGIWSTVPYLAALAAAIVWLLRRGRALGIATFAALTLAQWAAPASDERSAVQFLKSVWTKAGGSKGGASIIAIEDGQVRFIDKDPASIASGGSGGSGFGRNARNASAPRPCCAHVPARSRTL